MRMMDLPEETSRRFPCLRLSGNERLEVENHRGVLELTRTRIRLYTSLGILRVSGNCLEMRECGRETALIDGRICAVEYEIS